MLALCVHGAGAAALLAHWNESTDQIANAPVIAIELAPLPVAPEIKPTELPPGPQQSDAQPSLNLTRSSRSKKSSCRRTRRPSRSGR